MKTKMILDLFPEPFPNHKLTRENTLEGYGPWKDVIIERGTFFNKCAYVMRPGWKLLGWARPPYGGSSSTAVVFEKTDPADPEGVYHETKEPGLYWMHCSSGYKMVVDESLPEPVQPKPKKKRKIVKRKKKSSAT